MRSVSISRRRRKPNSDVHPCPKSEFEVRSIDGLCERQRATGRIATLVEITCRKHGTTSWLDLPWVDVGIRCRCGSSVCVEIRGVMNYESWLDAKGLIHLVEVNDTCSTITVCGRRTTHRELRLGKLTKDTPTCLSCIGAPMRRAA